jgi:hypothetical protein
LTLGRGIAVSITACAGSLVLVQSKMIPFKAKISLTQCVNDGALPFGKNLLQCAFGWRQVELKSVFVEPA